VSRGSLKGYDVRAPWISGCWWSHVAALPALAVLALFVQILAAHAAISSRFGTWKTPRVFKVCRRIFP